jgi:hypothetical protein
MAKSSIMIAGCCSTRGRRMFAQQQHDRRRFLGMAALSLRAALIGTRDSVIQLITVKPLRLSSPSDPASLGVRGRNSPDRNVLSFALRQRAQ